jgi:hypothetical protein
LKLYFHLFSSLVFDNHASLSYFSWLKGYISLQISKIMRSILCLFHMVWSFEMCRTWELCCIYMYSCVNNSFWWIEPLFHDMMNFYIIYEFGFLE